MPRALNRLGCGIHLTDPGLEFQHGQESTETNELANQHAKFDDLGITEVFVELDEERVVYGVVTDRKALRVFQRRTFDGREVVCWLVQLGDLCFSQSVFCILQKACVQSGEAIVQARNLQAHKLDQCFINRSTFARRDVEAEVVVKERLAVTEAARGGRVSAGGLDRLDPCAG